MRHEKVRFVMTGTFNTGFDFLMLNTLVFILGAYPLIANTISVTIGITLSYILNHKFVFRSPDKLSFRKYITFFAITGFSSLVIQNSIIYGFQIASEMQFGAGVPMLSWVMETDVIRLNIAKATAVLAGMVWNFTLYKFVVFRKSKQPATEGSDIGQARDSI